MTLYIEHTIIIGLLGSDDKKNEIILHHTAAMRRERKSNNICQIVANVKFN